MKLRLICDNSTYIDRYYLAEPAFSLWLENEGDILLFDTGYSDVYLKNMEKMGLDPLTVDIIALSHGHNDHAGGLVHFPKRCKLIAHPLAFVPKFYQGQSVGSFLTETEIRSRFDFEPQTGVSEISPHLFWLGEIPRHYPFESGRLENDPLKDDTAMAYVRKKDIILLTGCSHSGICNITRYAKELFQKDVSVILGGLHLLDDEEKAELCAQTLKELGVREIYPCHSTDLKSRFALMRHLSVQEAAVDLSLTF